MNFQIALAPLDLIVKLTETQRVAQNVERYIILPNNIRISGGNLLTLQKITIQLGKLRNSGRGLLISTIFFQIRDRVPFCINSYSRIVQIQ